MLPENIIFIAVFLNLIGQFLYIKSILRGHAKPNLVSWGIWMFAPFIGFFFQLKAGAGLSSVPIFMAGFGPLVIVAVALLTKNGVWKITSFDLLCGFSPFSPSSSMSSRTISRYQPSLPFYLISWHSSRHS